MATEKTDTTRPIDIPAGDARREAMAVAKDELAQKAEQQAAELELAAIDPDKLIVENALAQHFNALDVSGALPGYEYLWCYTGNAGNEIKAHVSTTVRIGGTIYHTWEVVQGNMPEALELKDVNGNRRLGDVILLRCRKPLYDALQVLEQEKRERRSASVTSNLVELGEKYRSRGVIVHAEHALADPQVRAAATQAAARGIARKEFDKMLRDGAVPGLGTK